MTVTNDVRKALETQLLTIQDTSGDPSIAFENVNFKPQGNEQWIRARIEFTERRPSGVGVGVDLLYQGIMLIDVFGNADEGSGSLETLADNVMDLFPYGSTFTENQNNVKIRFTERSGALYDKPWYQIPITVSFYVYI